MEPQETSGQIEWHALEHQPLAHSTDWFWALGIISVASALTAIILGNILFGLLLIIAGLSIAILARREPRTILFTLHKRGLSIDDTLYPIDHLKAFWILEKEDEILLLIDTPRFMTPDLVISLEHTDPHQVHEWFTAREIPEKELRESFSLKFLEFFGF